jgi:peptidyl-prolyl cis-trans isomerase C
MKISFLRLHLALLGILFSANLLAQGSNTVLATVGDSKIYSTQLNDWVSQIISDGGKDTPELRQTLLNDLIVREAILQNVKKTGLLSKGNNAFKVRVAEQNAVLEIWFSQYQKDHPITESEIRVQYDQQAAIAKDPRNAKEYQISQIVVAAEPEADELIKQINGGASFERIASDKSLDKTSGARGGSIGWVLPTKLSPPLDSIIPNVSKGKITAKPLQIGKFWYIVKVDDIRQFTFPSFDQAKPSIEQALLQKQKQKAIQSLLEGTKVNLNKSSK